MGTCDAVRDVLGTAPTTVLPTPRTSLVLFLRRNPRTAWARPSGAVRTLTRSRPPPGGPSERRHVERGKRYSPQEPPRRPLELPGRRRDLRKAKDDIQDDYHAKRHTPQCTFYSAQPLHPRDLGRIRRLPRFPRACTLPLLVSIKGGRLALSYRRGQNTTLSTTHKSTHALLSPDIGTRLNQLLH